MSSSKEKAKRTFQLLLEQHVERLQPADGVEYALVEEMASAYWRLHRNWAMEKRMIDTQARNELSRDPLDRYVAAFRTLSAGTAYPLLHRYETRLHNMYQRSLRTFLQLRAAKLPNEPTAAIPNEPNEEAPSEPNAPFPNEPKHVGEITRGDAPDAALELAQPGSQSGQETTLEERRHKDGNAALATGAQRRPEDVRKDGHATVEPASPFGPVGPHCRTDDAA